MDDLQPNENFMTVGEIIDKAFGERNVNVVNHKLIQVILYILARQLRVLERQVEVQLSKKQYESSSGLSITEVKIHAMNKKTSPKGKTSKAEIAGGKRQTNLVVATAASAGPQGKRTSGPFAKETVVFSATVERDSKTLLSTSTSTTTTSHKTSTDKTTTSETTSSYKTSTDLSSNQISSTTSGTTTSDKITSTETTTSSDKTSTELTSSGQLTSTLTSDTPISDLTTTTTSTTYQLTSETTSTSIEKPSPIKISKTSTETSSEKPSTVISSTDKTTTSTSKTTTSKISTADIETPQSSEKSTTEESKATTESKSPIEELTSTTTTSTTTERKTATGEPKPKSVKGRHPKDYLKLLEAIEEQREMELRIINQRKDSQEVSSKSPTPMASLESIEAAFEKLLIVEGAPPKADKAKRSHGKTPRLSIVTQEQFQELAEEVKQLQEKFRAVGAPELPENVQLMQELRKGASLTDAMAALQLSSRLEATEKTIQQMLALITELASKTPGIDLSQGSKHDKTQASEAPSDESIEIPVTKSQVERAVDEETMKNRINYEDLDMTLQSLHDVIIEQVTAITTRTATNAENALKSVNALELRLASSLNFGDRMDNLEKIVSSYTEQINSLDTNLSSQLTNYQEELTQMQYDLEAGLDAMAEALADVGGDTTGKVLVIMVKKQTFQLLAVAELNALFNNLQLDLDNTLLMQKDLKTTQDGFTYDLDRLCKQIEILRDVKADREEVDDALRNKAGLGDLNGLVSIPQFEAVRGDFEKRIGAAYDKFNNQENVWQKIIDDLQRALNEKADIVQVITLRDDLMRHLNTLRSRINALLDIVGEPKAAAISKKLFRDAACLSCSAPAQMLLEEPGIVPSLPAFRPPAVGAEAPKPKEDGDHKPCYPGLPISHPIDQRAHFCRRWCGGSHTTLPSIARVPPGSIVTQALRQTSTMLGTDGKPYLVEAPREPCRQCLIEKPASPTSETKQVSSRKMSREPEVDSLNMTPPDFLPRLDSTQPPVDGVSLTPPLEDFCGH